MPLEHLVPLVAAAVGAGALNAAAAGGSFLALPALVFTGVPSIVANATGTAALPPGDAGVDDMAISTECVIWKKP